jgi:ABC-type iron transport system FetAB ATPase subunit
MTPEFISRYQKFKSNLTSLRTYQSILASQLKTLEQEETDARYKIELYQKGAEVIKQWLDDALKTNVDSMAELATMALRHIMFDQELTFRIKQEAKYNRIAIKFTLEEESPKGIVEGNPMDSYGGSAAVIISFVLRLAIMSRMGMGNLLLLDESMFAISAQYIPKAAAFMRQLSEETGINILMVTHNPSFLEYAHTAYEGHKDKCLKLTKVKTEEQSL